MVKTLERRRRAGARRTPDIPDIPQIVSPGMHAAIDYMTAGTFFLSALRNWNRRRRAAIGAAACGLIEAGSVLMTDVPGGVWKIIPFRTHLKMDYGLAGLVAAVPSLLFFGDTRQSGFFRMQGIMIGAIAA